MRLLSALVTLIDQKGGSHIHLLEGQPACVRIDGKLIPVPRDGKEIVVAR